MGNIASLAKPAPPKRTEGAAILRQQARRLVATMDGLYQLLVLRRPPPDEADLEMSIQDIRIFIVLAHSVPMTMSAFAATLGVPLSTATNSIERLVKKGLVQRRHSERDRRVVQVELSPAGRKQQERFFARRLAIGRDMLALLSPGEREIFLELLNKMALLANQETRL